METLLVFLFGALPILEPRAGIPLGIFQFGMTPWTAGVIAFLGSLFAILLVVPLLHKYGYHLTDKFPIAHRLLERTARRHTKHIEHLVELGIFLIAFSPIPILSGVWTAMIAGFIGGVPKRPTIIACMLGSLGNCILITTAAAIYQFAF